MGYISDYRTLCTSRATNPEWPLELLDSIEKEFQQGLDGGILDPLYISEKLESLKRHVDWLKLNCDPLNAYPKATMDEECCDCSGCDECGSHCTIGCASGEGEEC